MKIALQILGSIYGVFVLGFMVHTFFAWRENERLHRLAKEDKARRERRPQS